MRRGCPFVVGRFKLSVIAPCSQDWGEMAGDDRARFCKECDLTVHDLSAMSEADARALLAGPAERVCVRFGVRRDGTVVTRSPVRWLGASLGALGIAVAAVAFWAGVTFLQRPWRALARKLIASPAPLQWPASKDDEERSRHFDEVQKQLAASTARLAESWYGAQYSTMGTADRYAFGSLDFSQHPPPKRTKKPRR